MRATLLLLLVGLSTLASAKLYHGYRLLSVTPSTEQDMEMISLLIDTHRLQEWTQARVPELTIDVLVPPDSFKALSSVLMKYNITAITKIEDVQKLIDQQMKEQRGSAPSTLPRTFNHTRYHRLAEIYSILDGVETDSSLVTTYTAGTTYEGRKIRVAKVSSSGDGRDKKAIWIDCGIHAREWVAPATCLYILDQLTSGSAEAAHLLNNYDFHIMPSANPDGYEYSWKHDRFWRKNRVSYGTRDCYGVDPNRNFDSHFGDPGASNSPCSETYHGPSAFSEKESQAIRDSVKVLNVKMFFTIHSYSQLWMTPYGYTKELPSDYNEQFRVSGEGVRALTAVYGTTYRYGNIPVLIPYMVSGGSTDWAYDSANIKYPFVLELRDTGKDGFVLPEEQILPTGKETFAGIVAAIKAV